MAETVLSVQNLEVSFRTDKGMVRAVRNVSFDLQKGETLCIVGESGSGKSVTSKAIMGILAGNAVIDQGRILYEGEDLTRISEEEFHRIRGKKIGMIFQDPLSSLNPIMRIGKQITEAMLINHDRLKKVFQETIVEELVALKNKEQKLLLAKEDIVYTYRDTIAKDKKKKAEAKKVYKAKLAALKAEKRSELPVLREKLKQKKLFAKQEVKRLRDQLKQEHAIRLREIRAMESTNQEKKNALRAEKDRFQSSLHITKKEAKARAIQVMREVGIPFPERRFKQYPFEFSGGMRQRIVIAIALTANPDILICDEPTTALDVTIQSQILELINRLKVERQLSCIFITHDLGVVANMADRVAVMYAGKIVEYGTADDIFYDPRHPYTWALLSSIPDIDSKERLEAIPGTPPNMVYPPKGDAFALRSRYAMNIDFREEPPFFQINATHFAATWLLHENAPKVEKPKIVTERIKNALRKEKSK